MPQPQSTADKLTDALIKLIWAGSGGYALYSVFYTEDIPQAAISGLVSFGAALITSFGQGLMGQLTGSMKSRGEQTGKLVDQTINTTVDITWARLSRFHRQYLEALKAQCYAIEIEGFQDLPPLALEDVYVPLRIECMDEGREVEPETLERLQAVLTENPLIHIESQDLAAEVLLEQRFRELQVIGDGVAITSAPITWNEYMLFLYAQQEKLFHSTAKSEDNLVYEKSAVTGISHEDAQWFCAWLSTQSNLCEEGKVFDYRLPTKEELAQVPAENLQNLRPWTAEAGDVGNALLVVRQELPERYGALVNYLANGRWKEADEETYKVMKQVANGPLSPPALQNFPYEDLRVIDQLWVRFSGGRFGFSVQKQLFVKTGNPLDGKYHKETWERFCNINGWMRNGRYVSPVFNTVAPQGHLPWEPANQIYIYRGGNYFSDAVELEQGTEKQWLVILLSRSDL